MISTRFWRVAWAAPLCFTLTLIGCKTQTANHGAGQSKEKSNRIVAVSYPLQFLTQRIVGDSRVVEFPAAGIDPQNWQPTREAIAQMQSADMIVANGTGATYAHWLMKVALAESKICNTASRGMSLRDFIAVNDVSIVHTHGPEGEHSHQTMVARPWLDPTIAKKQATYIAEQLKRIYPDSTDIFETNLKTLVDDLDSLVTQMEAIKSNHPATVVLATPRLKFFTRASGVPDRHLVWLDPPSPEAARSDLEKLLSDPVFVDSKPDLILFDNRLPNAEIQQLLTTHQLVGLPINLIDQVPESGDYLSAMRSNIERFSAALNR